MSDVPFDFESVPDRRPTSATKWQRYAGRDVLPFWVADMDFRAPPAVLEALHRRVDHGVFGYTDTPEALVETFRARVAERYGWQVEPEWLVWLPGVVPGFNMAATAAGDPSAPVLVPRPVYYPFLDTPANARRPGAHPDLIRAGSGACARWEMDLEAVAHAATPGAVFMLCNPQNPTGRCYGRGELEALAELACRRDLVICSDEIHCDLILGEATHVPIAALDSAVAARTITLMAPTKTFNLPGLGCAVAVIPDRALRRRFQRARLGRVGGVSPLAFAAAEAAWQEGDAWLEALLEVLRDNARRLRDTVEACPGVRTTEVEATCLAWIDCTELPVPPESLHAHFEAHGLGLSPGEQFGGPGFVRFNFGCPPELLREGLERFRAAVAAAG